MKRWVVIVELPAEQDLAEAYEWLAERNSKAAELWFDAIHDTIASLEMFPERCPLAPESVFFNCEIREIFHGRRHHKFRILFTIAHGQVHILHIRHGARLGLGEIDQD